MSRPHFFLRSLEPLRTAGKLGPVLFQLPPYLRLDLPRLAAFLELLPPGLRATIEFRHDSWFTDDVYELLRAHGVALCVAETEKLVVPEVVTADFVYERLRKPDYSAAELAAIGARAAPAARRRTRRLPRLQARGDAGGSARGRIAATRRLSGRGAPSGRACRPVVQRRVVGPAAVTGEGDPGDRAGGKDHGAGDHERDRRPLRKAP